jgi:hypothetical protein
VARLRTDPYYRRDVELSARLGVPLSVYLGAPRDQAFTDVDRDALAGLYALEAETCDRCGQPIEVCSDPTKAQYPQRSICWSTAVSAMARRVRTKIHDGEPVSTADFTDVREEDAEQIWASVHDLTPDDDFLTP